MTVVTVIDRVREEGLSLLRARPGIELALLPEPTPETLMAAMPRSEAILVRTTKLTPAMLDAATRLKVVSRHGVGYDNVPLEPLTRRRIPLAIAATANMIAVAEHTIFAMMELAKHGRAFDSALRRGDWALRNRLSPVELHGKTLLIVGFGRIGAHVARRARAFDMEVLVLDPVAPPERVAEAGCRRIENLGAGLEAADVVSLHCPLTEATRNLLGEAELARMRPGALLVNTARGGLVDEVALAACLASGRLGGAALDAFSQEPPPGNHPLLELPNVLLTPHMAGVTAEAALRMAVESAQNLLAALDGRLDPSVVVNPQVL
ncbi:hydroxyacid dehydrogenase [Geminicoccaceae bacterium 1502E]|nr:hydroxyacid dehydrogenase [Geminicoccaceae bacterium 1502E]